MKSPYKDYDPEALKASFIMVGIEYAHPSPTNPRKSFPEAEMAELIESVKEHGVLQPILVRSWPMAYESPLPTTTYEIIAGERRWRAAKAAGLKMLEAKIRELSDLEVLEIQIIENLQRQDLHPLEEAEGYERIMGTHAYTAEKLAEKIGKSRSYIFGRLKLLALDDEARRLFRGGMLNASTALLIARIPNAALRAKAIAEITELDYNHDPMSVREAQRHLQQRYMLKLETAPFPISDETLTPVGSCSACPKRTGNSPDLFEDVDSPDVCTDPDCFVAKKIAHRDREAEKVVAAGGTVIVGEEAKKITKGNGVETYSDLKGFTMLEKTCYEDPEHRTYAQILGDDYSPVLLEDERKQVMVPVVPNNILAEKLQAAGVKLRAQEDAKANEKVQAKLTLERATRQRMFEMVRENVTGLAKDDGGFAYPLQNRLFNLIVQRLWERLGIDGQFPIANQWQASGKNNTERAMAFGQCIPAMETTDLWTLAIDILLISGTTVHSEWDLEHGGKQLKTIAEQFDIDAGEIRKVVQAELKAKEAEAKPAKKAAKKPKKSPTAEAAYPSKAARAADLAAEDAAHAGEPTAEATPTPSAGADLIETVEKPSGLKLAFALDDVVCVREDANEHGIPYAMAGQVGTVVEIHYDGGYVIEFAAGHQEVFGEEAIEMVEKPIGERCTATVDMFKEAV